MRALLLLIISQLLFVPAHIQAESTPGFVVGWGNNISGQATGIPSVDPYLAAGVVTISEQRLSDATAIAAGFSTSLALKHDGTVAGWGGNGRGNATGEISTYPDTTNGLVRIKGQMLDEIVSIATGNGFSLGLKKDGTFATWGKNYVPPGLSNIVAIAADWGGSWALRRDGTVIGWSSQPSEHDYGQLHTIEGLSNAVAIAVGQGGNGTRGLALKHDGTLAFWGKQTIYNDATPPDGLSGVTAIAVGPSHSLALKKDGTVMGWGFNINGEATGEPTTNRPYFTHGLVRINGQVLNNVAAVAANAGMGMQNYSLALKKDGTVVGWGHACPKIPEGLKDVVAISAGQGYCLAITTNKAVADRFSR